MTQFDANPMTWVDIARALASSRARVNARELSLVRARVGWFGVLLEGLSQQDDDTIAKWLEELFPERVRHNPLRLALEGPEHAEDLAVSFELLNESGSARQTFGVVDGAVEFGPSAPAKLNHRPVPLAATLSVKGGTGRTTAAVALALHWASRAGRPVLLVDADLEAPGISYLFRAEAGAAKIALEDLIALAHVEDNTDSRDSIAYVSERLRDHAVKGDVFILPLRRDLDELASSAVRPEHLSTPERPFALADMLSSIAHRLGCAGVVVDVRAGLVPIGVNMAMDPEVSPVIVTTLSDQALKATSSFVRFLAREMRKAGAEPKRPLIIVNRVPHLYRQTRMDQKLLEPLSADLLSSLVPERDAELPASQGIFDDSAILEPYFQVEVPELPDLQVSSGSWSNYTDQLISSGFNSSINIGFDQWLNADIITSKSNIPASTFPILASTDTNGQRDRLATFSDGLIAAENLQGPVSKPLVTRPLASLTQRFQSEVPIAVSEGSKGTGKTLAARYFISQKGWSEVVRELIGGESAVPALILPVCASVQSSGGYQEQVDRAREEISKVLDFREPQKVSATTAWLKERMTHAHSEQDWVAFWLDVTAWAAGYEPDVPGAGDRLVRNLREKNRNVVAVFEGLEELYTNVVNTGVVAAMRAVLVSLPQRLRSEPRRPLGMIAFARQDTVEAAVSQNLDQYRREYASFALTWTDDDVLELAAWLATQANAIEGLWTPKFGSLGQEEKAQQLEVLWGRKLGPDDEPGRRIREAYTATWIIAVLSDLQGRLVPRDLIRLLSFAARVPMMPDERLTYAGRLLIPRALKRAVEPTSEKKVEETVEEIKELEPIFARFRSNADTLAAPLDQAALDTLGLKDVEVDTLKRHGIVFGDKPPFEVPELFRRGLRLKHAGARRSVVNLYRRARKL